MLANITRGNRRHTKHRKVFCGIALIMSHFSETVGFESRAGIKVRLKACGVAGAAVSLGRRPVFESLV